MQYSNKKEWTKSTHINTDELINTQLDEQSKFQALYTVWSHSCEFRNEHLHLHCKTKKAWAAGKQIHDDVVSGDGGVWTGSGAWALQPWNDLVLKRKPEVNMTQRERGGTKCSGKYFTGTNDSHLSLKFSIWGSFMFLQIFFFPWRL